MHRLQHWAATLGLWPRMALGISVGVLMLFVAFSLLGERTLRDSTDRLLEERLVIASMAAGQLDTLLQQAVADLQQARRFADFDPGDPSLSDEAHLLAHTYGRIGTFTSGITFLDATGHVVLAHPPERYPPGTDLSGFPYVRHALERQEVSVSAPFVDPISKQSVAAVTIPIFNDQGSFLGLLGGLIDLQGSAITLPLHQAATFGETGHAFLIDSHGRTLASTYDVPFLSPGEHVTFYREVMARGSPVVDSVPVELEEPGEPPGHEHVMAVAPLEMAPWGVAVGGNADETFAGVRRLRLGLILLGAIALLGT